MKVSFSSLRPRTAAAGVVLGGVVLVSAMVLPESSLPLFAPVASAHSVLLEVTPDNGSTVTAAPRQVRLTFNEDINPDFVTLTVMDSQQTNHLDGEATVDGPQVTGSVDSLPAGDYTIGYRVTSADGHVIQGSSEFTVAGSTSSAPSAATATDDTNPTVSAAVDNAKSDSNAVSGTGALFVLGGLSLALIVGAILLLRHGRS